MPQSDPFCPHWDKLFLFLKFCSSVLHMLLISLCCLFPCLMRTNNFAHLPGSHECSAVLVIFVCMTVWGGGQREREKERPLLEPKNRLTREFLTQWLTRHILSFGVGSGVWIHRGLKHHRDSQQQASKTSSLSCPNPPIIIILFFF